MRKSNKLEEEIFLLKITELKLLKDKYNLIDITKELSRRLNINLPDRIDEICSELGIGYIDSVLGNGLSKSEVESYYRNEKINNLLNP